jgi:hypothetical protein
LLRAEALAYSPLQTTLNNVAVLGLLMFGWDHSPLIRSGKKCSRDGIYCAAVERPRYVLRG